MESYLLEVQEDSEGNLLLQFPQDLIDTLGWQVDDLLVWKLKGDSVYLSRLDGPAEPDALEKLFY